MRRLEESGIITGYLAEVDPARIGLPIMALIEMRCDHNTCMLKLARPNDYPAILEVLKVGGAYCIVLKPVVSSTAHLEDLTDRLGEHGPVRANIVWSSGLSRRIIDWDQGIPDVEPGDKWG